MDVAALGASARGEDLARARVCLWRHALAGALAMTVYFVLPEAHGSLINLVGIEACLAIVVGVRVLRPANPAAWYLTALGIVLLAAGDAGQLRYPGVTGESLRLPSEADVLDLAAYPFLIAALLSLVRARRPGRDREVVLDALILGTGFALVAWLILMAPYASDPMLSLPVKLVSLAHPVMDVLLVGVLAVLALGGGFRLPAFGMLMVAMVAILVSDLVYGVVAIGGWLEESELLGLGWLGGYLLFGAAALHPSMRRLAERVPVGERRGATAAPLLLAVLLVPVLLVSYGHLGLDVSHPVVVTLSLTLAALVVARLWILLRATDRARVRERILREAGAGLVTSTDRREIIATGERAVRRLVGPRRMARVFELTEGGRLLETGGGPVVVQAPDLRGLSGPGYAPISLPIASALHVPTRFRRARVWTLRERDRDVALLLMAGRRPLKPDAEGSVETLVLQITLALESAALAEDVARGRSEARFRSLVQHASDLVSVVAPDTEIRYQSPSSKRVLGSEPEELTGRQLIELAHADDVPVILSALSEAQEPGGRTEPFLWRIRARDGAWVHLETLASNLVDDPLVEGIVLNSRDVRERIRYERQLQHQAFHDPLTGLPNRALFRDRLVHAMAKRQPGRGGVTVAVLDLDDFKTVNDSLGHGAGDRLLLEIGRRLMAAVRPADTVARFEGDEFAVLLEDVRDVEDAEAHVGRIVEALRPPVRMEGREVFIRACVGLAEMATDGGLREGADELIRNADMAMYVAKRRGKDRIERYVPSMHSTAVARLELSADLQRAVELEELRLEFQPIVRMATGAWRGVETLVRWEHPRKGLTEPGAFVPLAEETGLIVPIGAWVLREACHHAKRLRALQPALEVGVNLSARQFQHRDLVQEVEGTLSETGIDPSGLVLEVTESVVMADTEMTIARLRALKGLGIRVAIDDFGTGFSSLSYLQRFPVDVLKIDRSFVAGVAMSDEDRTLTAAIIELARRLGLDVVAEGVEEEAQAEVLQALGCDLAQGFLYGRSADPIALEEALGVPTVVPD